jgi:hypothetical protein
MDRQEQLQAFLSGANGERTAYHQPPSNAGMKYPCIVYIKDNANTQHANNSPYRFQQRWQVTVIDRDTDSKLFDFVRSLPSARFTRHYVTNGLNHDVFTLYF